MRRGLVGVLLVVFALHLLVFARLALRRRRASDVSASATFALLVAAFALRLWRPELAFAGRPLHAWPRFAAWGTAALTLALALARRRRGAGPLR